MEIFGYLLSGDTRAQKLFLFMGKSRSGKGTLARVLRRLIGVGNVIGFALESLDNDFGAEDLIDKQVAIVGDARLDGKSHEAVSRLLSYSGEDAVTINRKNEKKWHGTLGVRFLILTNPLLHFTDASGVIATRFFPVLFSESFLGRENDNKCCCRPVYQTICRKRWYCSPALGRAPQVQIARPSLKSSAQTFRCWLSYRSSRQAKRSNRQISIKAFNNA